MNPLRLITWNINRGGKRVDKQVSAICRQQPDIACLQEITLSCLPYLRERLQKCGFPFVIDSLSSAPRTSVFRGPRRYGQLVASKFPTRLCSSKSLSVPWPERVLKVLIHANGLKLAIYNVHIPPGCTNSWIKIKTLNGIYRALARRLSRPTILCGDFNTPKEELADGTVITWGQVQRADGRYDFWREGRRQSGQLWDRGERDVLVGLGRHGFVDAYRAKHGYKKKCFSWYWRGRGRRIGRRFDHVFFSEHLHATLCDYVHSVRHCGLSDHSALRVTFEPANRSS